MTIQRPPLTQYLTYERDELLNNLEYVRNAMHHIDQLIVYMEEQGLGRRNDQDWEDCGARMREYFDDALEGLNRMSLDVPFDNHNLKRLEVKPKLAEKYEDDDLPF